MDRNIDERVLLSSSSSAYKTGAILYKDKYNLALNYRRYETKISIVHSGNVTNPSVSFVAQRMRAFDLFNAVYVHKTWRPLLHRSIRCWLQSYLIIVSQRRYVYIRNGTNMPVNAPVHNACNFISTAEIHAEQRTQPYRLPTLVINGHHASTTAYYPIPSGTQHAIKYIKGRNKWNPIRESAGINFFWKLRIDWNRSDFTENRKHPRIFINEHSTIPPPSLPPPRSPLSTPDSQPKFPLLQTWI